MQRVPLSQRHGSQYNSAKQICLILVLMIFMLFESCDQSTRCRSGEVIEPMLSDQWFVSTEALDV